MEVKTGKIKAISNLGRANGNYTEKYNYALGHEGSYEPGSTFKLMSLMAAIEDRRVDTSDVFDTGNGVWKFKDRTIYDSDYKYGGHGKISVKKIFELSSNVGVAKIITESYGKKQQDYYDRLISFGLNIPLDLDIPGEATPFYNSPKNKYWSGTSLAWMSYGYEVKMTPLQILTFYNAVANDGKMVKPRLIQEIRDMGAVVKRYDTEVLKWRIASRRTIRRAQEMLEGVCETGTAKNLKSPYFKMAGKTGTAQVSAGDKGYKNKKYLSSFAGYFPADNPEFSMIVTVFEPRGEFYGGAVAAPVFKEVAEKIFAAENVYDEVMEDVEDEKPSLPDIRKGKPEDIRRIARKLNIRGVRGNPDSEIAKVNRQENKLVLAENEIKPGLVPDVRGLGASNAVYLLENSGLQVKLKGSGKVREQSLSPGQKCFPGNVIYLTLR
jgi:cell division protein FtsI (penicillin-binding protein 3)